VKYNPKITQKNKFTILQESESVSQPDIDYGRLSSSLDKTTSADKPEDLRKQSFYTKTDLSDEPAQELSKISKDSIIPVPGMLIEYENSESGDSVPMSNWVAPHGPQWGPAMR
jgi:hypothetical protein